MLKFDQPFILYYLGWNWIGGYLRDEIGSEGIYMTKYVRPDRRTADKWSECIPHRVPPLSHLQCIPLSLLQYLSWCFCHDLNWCVAMRTFLPRKLRESERTLFFMLILQKSKLVWQMRLSNVAHGNSTLAYITCSFFMSWGTTSRYQFFT